VIARIGIVIAKIGHRDRADRHRDRQDRPSWSRPETRSGGDSGPGL